MSDLISACMAFTGPLEGNIPWPYRDNAKAGNATVGRGHLLYGALYAANVFEVPLDTLQPQWDDLMKAEGGKVAGFYETITDLRITAAKSDDLFRSDLECHIEKCGEVIPDFDKLGWRIQAACVDISFNVGTIARFPKMIGAIEAKDWESAADESNRPQLPARSKATRELILSVLAPVVVT